MKQVHVLVVDDNEDHRFLVSRAFRDVEGVEVSVDGVADGAEALDYLHRRDPYADRPLPNLVLLDLRMPKVNGFEVLEHVKADPELSAIPIVVLSSSGREEDVDYAYRLGGNSYIVKPGGTEGLRKGLKPVTTCWTANTALPYQHDAA